MTFLLNSCSNDDAIGPDLTITSEEDLTVPANSLVTIEWRADAGDAKLEFFTIKEGNIPIVDFNDVNWNNYEIPNAENENFIGSATVVIGEENTSFTLTVTDKDGLTDQQIVSVAIDVTATGNPINEYTAVLGAQDNATYGSSLDADAGQVYLLGPARTNAGLIDMIYVYDDGTSAAIFAAPTDNVVNGGVVSWCSSNWDPKNDTRFKETSMTAGEFDAIEHDGIIAAITDINATKISGLSVNDVFAFETVEGNKGLIKVSALEAGETETITIAIKVQQ